MSTEDSWQSIIEALEFAVSRIEGDPDPLNDRERADGNLYVMRMLTAVTQSTTLTLDPDRPSFLTMLDGVRFVGAAGPDIDYDVAAVRPDCLYSVAGARGEATYVGITVYAGAGAGGASAVVASVDVDDIMDADGTFVWEFSHPEAARVIVRQYFHDRATQTRGSWLIERVDAGASEANDSAPASRRMGSAEMSARVSNAAKSLRWNAQLNQLWTPERRSFPNEFVRQTCDDIVAAIPNPDVVYSTTWWKMADDEVVVVDFVPPTTDYWALQLCDRWYQCFPDRRTNINNREAVVNADGSVRIVISDGDPGVPNWLDTSGHHTGVMFFRWLHADIAEQPVCRVVKRSEVGSLSSSV
ncbi:unannotated protein [freshwater metagenome]|uniref:Unannotated protein n=1 Tax=freshwater metagenome TaxID=449393 RepID=A0A6J6DGY2_9ZZZZ|nr:DUF1254 domain-containing protein [Actinomycetota bacterium]MTA18005.1 DUF1254 domain-containing protein [Actinomycetota bacterium]MTA88097.1 DUF1254 domain-containing protein [Actinomycetota bacterium]